MESKPLYPAKQLQMLKLFYGHSVEDIAARLNMGVATVSNAMNGKSSVVVEKFAQIADFLNADLEITLKPRDPRFIDHLKRMMPDRTKPQSEITAPRAGAE